MIYKSDIPGDTPIEWTTVTYAFLAPTQVTIRHADGRRVITGFGIGEQIKVLEPRMINLLACYAVRSRIPLADGSEMVEWPSDMRYERVWL